jgi:uncharacterized protein with HEPN domain
VHGYAAVDRDIIWDVIRRDIPALLRSIEGALEHWPV